MSAPTRKPKKQDYPAQTEGSRLAAKIRGETNQLSEEQRRAHLNAAMVLIYGGSQSKKTPVR
jgi:hypothetical protein